MDDLDWIEPADWRRHSPGFVDVRVHDDGRPIVVMELVPPDRAAVGAGWDRLRQLWLDLPLHPDVLDAVDRCGDDMVLLRYAALDWRRRPARLRDGALRTQNVVADWGIQLSSAMETILSAVTEQEAAWFSCPLVMIDLDEHARMGFLPASPYAPATRRYLEPEVGRRWPGLDECGLVHVRRLGRRVVREGDPPPVVELSPWSSARDQYMRGKELYAAGRLDDARASLERAFALDPRLIEAMHLRRAIDRWARRAFEEAGHQYPPTPEAPDDERNDR